MTYPSFCLCICQLGVEMENRQRIRLKNQINTNNLKKQDYKNCLLKKFFIFADYFKYNLWRSYKDKHI